MTDPKRKALGILALCFLFNLVSRGIGEGFAIFLLPLAREFGSDRAALTGVYAIFMLVAGVCSPVVGMVVDRLGPRFSYGLGLALLGSALLLAGSSGALWHLYLTIGVLAPVGAMLIGMVPAANLASRWFHARLATAMGVLYAGTGTGVLVIAPLTQWLIDHAGWRGAYHTLGAAVLVLVVPVTLLPWRAIAAGSPGAARAAAVRIAAQPAWSIARAMRNSTFWALFGVLFFTSVNSYMIMVQLVAYLVHVGFSPLKAASTFGLVGMLSIVGMFGAGFLAERIGERRVATLSYSTTIVGIVLLALLEPWPSGTLLAGFVVLFGTMQGSRGPLVAVLSARHFAGSGQSGIYGAILIGMGAGGALGAWAGGALFDLTGGYRAVFVLGAVCAACGMAMFWTVRALYEGDGRVGS